jgi:hypothetical protein
VVNNTEANGRLAMLETWQAEPDGLTVTFPPANLAYSEILGVAPPSGAVVGARGRF